MEKIGFHSKLKKNRKEEFVKFTEKVNKMLISPNNFLIEEG